MSKPDRPPNFPPEDLGEALRSLVLALLGFPPPLVFAGFLFMTPAVGLLYVGVPKILSGEINISLSGALCVVIALIMAWGGVEMIRADPPKGRW